MIFCRFFLFIFIGNLPLSFRRFLGTCIGSLLPFFLKREQTIAELQMRRFLSLSTVQAKAISKKVFKHMGRQFFISLNTKPVLRTSMIEWSSQSGVIMEQLQSLNVPILAFTAHIGNWDLLGAYCHQMGFPVFTIGRKARSKMLQPFLQELRLRNGVTTIWREDPKSPKRILQALKERLVLAALIDQDTTVRSEFVPFFGVPVKTPVGLFDLANRFNAFCVSAFLIEITPTRYRLYIEKIDPHLTEVEAISLYHKHLESAISSHPEQWAWFHKRWRSSKDSETLGTTAYIKRLLNELTAVGKKTFTTLLFFALSCFSSGCLFSSSESLISQADQLRSEKKFDEAIALYQEHIEKRLKIADREEWENPFFYELIIGDIFLEKGELTEAKQHYFSAEEHQVDRQLILDRIRLLASQYQSEGKLHEALDLLKPFAQEDPLLINAQLDRVAKQLAESSPPSSQPATK